MDEFKTLNSKRMVDRLMADLELDKPTIAEMIMEIKQVGLAIQLENTDVSFLERNKNEIITSMWKVVRVAKIMKDKNIDIEIDSPIGPHPKKLLIH